MRCVVNGVARELEQGMTLQGALEALDVRAEGVAVAVNMDFVPRSAYATRKLEENDEIEILSPQQGG